jgi:hypothetical protein
LNNRVQPRHPSGADLEKLCGKVQGTLSLFSEHFLVNPVFYRLLLFFVFIGFLKAIFLQMDYVFPKFAIRELGLQAAVGKISNINAIMIILFVWIVGALTQKYAAYRMVVIGGVICRCGVFIMALPPEWFQPAAESGIGQWIGHSYLGSQGKHSPVLHHVSAVSDRLLHWRNVLFATCLRVCGCDCPERSGSIIRLPSRTFLFWSANSWSGLAVGYWQLFARNRAHGVRDYVAHIRVGRLNRTDWD